MKRDLDLCRKILLKVAESPDDRHRALSIEGYSRQEVNYNIAQLHEAGLIRAKGLHADNDTIWIVGGLTWAGNDFLDAAKDNSLWEKAKATIAPLGGVGFDVMKAVLIELAKAQLGLSK